MKIMKPSKTRPTCFLTLPNRFQQTSHRQSVNRHSHLQVVIYTFSLSNYNYVYFVLVLTILPVAAKRLDMFQPSSSVSSFCILEMPCDHFFSLNFSDIEYLRKTLPSNVEEEFFTYLKNLSCEDITIHALQEGSIAFPRIPLMRIEGPLIVAQLLETTLLTLVNFAR